MALPDFPIPPYNFFYDVNQHECLNSFCGSLKGFNYRLAPKQPEDGEPQLTAYTWYGMLCSDLSERQGEASFPLTPEGREQAVAWLKEQNELYLKSRG